MRISSEHQKFLVAFRNENLFVDAVAKGTFLGMSGLPEISVQPQLRFLLLPIAIEKLIKT
jgi:hypothetical protein